MKPILHNPFARLVLTLGVIAATMALAVTLFGSPSAQASESSAPRAQAEATSTPPPPAPLNPPLRAPEAGQPQIRFGNQSTGLNAAPFVPKVQITRGKPLPTIQSAVKAPKGKAPSTGPHAPKAPHPARDFSPLVSSQDWQLLLYEDFTFFPSGYPLGYDFGVPFPATYGTSNWTIYDFSSSPDYRSWGAIEYYWNGDYYYEGWPAAFGPDAINPSLGYTDTLYSWLDYGPLDLSAMSDFYVDFWLWYDTEPDYDWMYFCVSTDGIDYTCDYWSGYSYDWVEQSYWLTSYVGYSTVYLAWIFESNGSVSGDYGYDGPYIDDIYVWADDTPPPPPPDPDPNGQLVQNGSFEDDPSLNYWTPPAPDGVVDVIITDTAPHETHVAHIAPSVGGDGFLYQTLNVPAGVSSVVVDYWFVLSTPETTPDRDFFCASLRSTVNWDIWADLGCIDSVDAPASWQESTFTLNPAEIDLVAGQPVDLVFEMYDTGSAGQESRVYVDYISVYATGAGAAAAIDLNEPNNDTTEATVIGCPTTTISGTVGDALGGYDIDWFRINNVPAGPLTLDIDAQTKVQSPRSTLDSVMYLYDNNLNQVAYNDDDSVTLDSFITYTVPVTKANSTYYASVESYTGAGDPTAFYDLTAKCNSTEAVPVGGNFTSLTPVTDTWTVMLFLNAEDANFESILTKYRTDIQGFIGGKQPWLKVLILYDGSGVSDTVRYDVQAGGVYTPGVNRWNLGELNMGDPSTLANFVAWAMDNYPAENYYLAIDDHGDGAYGISRDLNPAPLNQPQLTPPEVYSALKEGTRNGSRKISIVDYEACLMGLAENAYDVREWADYVVFSQQISWGVDTYPVYFSDLARTDTPLAVGQRIVARYSAEASRQERPHTISLIATSQLGALRTAIDSLANALQATGNQTVTIQARNASQAFAADREATNAYFADYIDLWDLAAQAQTRGLVLSAQAQAVQNAVDDAVVVERHVSGGLRVGSTPYTWDHSRVHGLSIYFPTDRTSPAFSPYTTGTLYQMTTGANGWDEFLSWVYPGGGEGARDRGMSMSRAELKLSVGETFVNVNNLYLPLIRR